MLADLVVIRFSLDLFIRLAYGFCLVVDLGFSVDLCLWGIISLDSSSVCCFVICGLDCLCIYDLL